MKCGVNAAVKTAVWTVAEKLSDETATAGSAPRHRCGTDRSKCDAGVAVLVLRQRRRLLEVIERVLQRDRVATRKTPKRARKRDSMATYGLRLGEAVEDAVGRPSGR